MNTKSLIEKYFRGDWTSFYQHYLPTHIKSRHNGELSALCPFHDDHTPSLSINIKNGTWFCHACGKGGDAFSFYQKLHHVSFAEAVKGIAQDFGLDGIDYQKPKQEKADKLIRLEVVGELQQALLSNGQALRVLEKKRGLILKTVQRFKLGYKADQKRLAIPIFDWEGLCVNIRLYSSSQKPKMLSWGEGYGAARLYPVERLEHNPIWIMEGELDALLAVQDSLNALSATCGAGTWREEWNKHFTGKDVVIAYDNDDAGRNGAGKVAKALDGVAKSVLILDWPEDFQEHGDYTDWRVKHGHSVTDFLTLPRRPLPAPDKPSSIPTSTLETRSLSFPFEAYTGLASEFAELYSSFTEAPRSFYYMAFLTALGTVIGHKVTLESEIKPQPRLYTVLLGESADDRKSTAIKLALDFFRSALTDFSAIWGVGSGEGLAERLKETPHLLLVQDEMKSFVQKCKIDGSVLLTVVGTLFENNRYSNSTKRQNIEIKDAYLSMLGASTVETYGSMWDQRFLDIGFLNRLSLVLDHSEPQHALPHKIPEEAKLELAKRLGQLLEEVELRYVSNDNQPVPLPLTQGARELFERWYLGLKRAIFTKRLDTYGHRLMILLALSNSRFEIDEGIVEKVIALLDYELEARREADPVDAETRIAQMEEKIRRALTNSPLSKWDIARKVHYKRYGIWFFENALKNLIKMGEVTLDRESGLYQLAR